MNQIVVAVTNLATLFEESLTCVEWGMGMKLPDGVVIYGHLQLGSFLMILLLSAIRIQLSGK